MSRISFSSRSCLKERSLILAVCILGMVVVLLFACLCLLAFILIVSCFFKQNEIDMCIKLLRVLYRWRNRSTGTLCSEYQASM